MHPAATFPSLPRPTPARGLALLLGLLAGIPALRADTPLNPAYSIVDLGTLGGTASSGFGVNNAGQVTGYAYLTGNSASHPFLYSEGGMTDLGTLGGINANFGRGINDAGEVTGSSYLTGDTIFHAFLYSSGVMTDLGTLGGTYSTGNGINNTGQVTGYADVTGSNTFHAFLYSGGVMTDLGTLGGTTSYAYGINSSGQVVGRSQITGNSTYHVFLYSGGVMHNINDLVGSSPIATNITMSTSSDPINDWGQITAYGTVGGQPHALLLNPVDPLTSTTGDSRNTRFVEGMRYEQFTSTTRSGGFGTTVALLDGTVGSGGSVAYAQGGYGRNRDVNVTFAGATPPPDLSSDVITLTGTFADTYVLSLSYDESVHGDDVILGWRSGLNDWVTAFGGYTGLGITPVSFDRAYDPDTDFVLGYHGVDAGTHTVWAVLNLEGDFAVFSSAVPEPSCALLLLAGLSTLALRRRRQTDTRPLS